MMDEQREEAYLNFLIEVLKAIEATDADPQVVYPLLEQNLDKLDENFAFLLQDWTANILSEVEPEEGYSIAFDVANFCVLIEEFPLGNPSNNIEIAIAGYEIIVNVITPEVLPQEWSTIQNHIGLAYLSRIEGEPVENQATAIMAFKGASEIRRREQLQHEWAETQNNLGLTYLNRIEGNRAENIEIAIPYFQDSLEVYHPELNPEGYATIHNNLGLAYFNRIYGNKDENIELAIKAFKAVLEVYTLEKLPQQWAETQYHLANAYSDRILGEKAENIEQTISCYQAALQFFTYVDFPEDWAQIKYHLALAYFNRINGERAENIELSIAAFQDSLQIYSPKDSLESWVIQYGLATLHYERIKGTRSANLEQAIYHYQIALQVCSIEEFPEQWGITQNELGMAFSERIKGERSENLEKALACFQATLQVFNLEDYPENWVLSQNNIGFAYYNRIIGNRSENIEQAISYYQLVLQICTTGYLPELWGQVKINLGVAYLNRVEGVQSENIEIAIKCFEEVLLVYTREALPQKWSLTQNNLGIAYLNHKKGNRSNNLEQSIYYYELALSVYPREANAAEWAMIQNNLGIAYSNRRCENKAQNIEIAIKAFEMSLQVRTCKNFPEQWAETQKNLATAYLNRIFGEPEENWEMALSCYKSALQIYTCEKFPQEWAEIQSLLGSLYTEHIDSDESDESDESEDIKLAVAHFNKALQVYAQSAYPQQWAKIQNLLGNAYSKFSEETNDESLALAVQHYKAALQVFSQEKEPEDWAMVKNNLGSYYTQLIKGNKEQNLKAAISCYQAALQGYIYENFPENWAMLQNNMALAYQDLGNITEAIFCFKSALRIRTPITLPEDCLRSSSNLGDTTFKVGNWQEAIPAYDLAIQALEQIRIWFNREDRRQDIMKNYIEVYENIVQACVNNGQLELAIEYVERSRCRRLVDLMASNDLYQGGEIPPEINEYLHEFENLQQQIDNQRFTPHSKKNQELVGVRIGSQSPNRAALKAANEIVIALEADKQQLWEKIRRLDPVLAGQLRVIAPNFASMQQLINQSTIAILNFYTLGDNTYIFILRQDQISCHKCSGEGNKTLQEWLNNNWLQPYLNNKEVWKSQINPILAELAQRVQLEQLLNQHLIGITEIIIIPHLYLHQIPFAALPLKDGQYLGDKFLIRYIPSCQVLEFCQKRGNLAEDQLLSNSLRYGIVEDATEDLPCSSFEAEQIAQTYRIPENRHLRGYSQATVSNYRQLIKEVEVIVSSHHAQSRLDNPLESRLELADGSITLGQLLTPSWRLPHLSDVFLSCCETGLGVIEITDDIFTLSTGFLCAGARSVVSTLWSVDDLATALFSIFYHRYRKEGKNRPVSLQMAQEELRSLSGQTLATVYQPQIVPMLESKFKQLDGDRKQAKTNRDQEVKDTPVYLQWDAEYKRLFQAAEGIRKSKNRLKALCLEPFPFAHPFYWAAFTCSGLR